MDKPEKLEVEEYLKRYALNQVEKREVQVFDPLASRIVKLEQLEAEKVIHE